MFEPLGAAGDFLRNVGTALNYRLRIFNLAHERFALGLRTVVIGNFAALRGLARESDQASLDEPQTKRLGI